jgi:signal transduction histidine kinase/DNA-binding response OmpR family regulator
MMKPLSHYAAPTDDSGHRKVNVLIVDDHPDKLLSLEAVLSSLGENIITAPSGRDALRKLMENDFAVILLDVNMPDMDGFEAATLIRQHPRCAHTPIIFVTAFGDAMHTEKGYSLGAVDYILSPVVPDVLRTKISVFVELFRKTEEIKRHAEERIALVKEQTARASAEEATRRSSFLAEATAVMTRSLDCDATLRGINQVVIPFLAELSAIVVVDEQLQPSHVEMAWIDTADQLMTASELDLDVFPENIRAAISHVLKSGSFSFLPELSGSADSAQPYWPNAQHPSPKLRSAVVLPLTARSRTIGALLLGIYQTGRIFGPTQLSLAEELAGRAGIAIDNSKLHESVKEHDRRKDDFLAMLGHELRNPLAPIRNAVEILKLTEPVNAISEQARDMIERQVAHMARLIDDLLDVSRIARGKIQLRKDVCDLALIVRETAQDHRLAMEANNLRLEVIVPDKPFWVLSDSTRISQIVGNLLQNAHKFTDAGGTITVELQRQADGEAAVLIVRDTGIGMDEVTLAGIFVAFSQADRSLDRSRGGLGLGLALVKGLVELHGGSVQATSLGPGQGSEFVVQLPLEPAVQQSSKSDGAPKANATNHRILIIEDNRDGAESMRTLLSLLGHQATVTHTVCQVLRLLARLNRTLCFAILDFQAGWTGTRWHKHSVAIRNCPTYC